MYFAKECCRPFDDFCRPALQCDEGDVFGLHCRRVTEWCVWLTLLQGDGGAVLTYIVAGWRTECAWPWSSPWLAAFPAPRVSGTLSLRCRPSRQRLPARQSDPSSSFPFLNLLERNVNVLVTFCWIFRCVSVNVKVQNWRRKHKGWGLIHTMRFFLIATAILLIATNGLHRTQRKCSHYATATSPTSMQPIVSKNKSVTDRTVWTGPENDSRFLLCICLWIMTDNMLNWTLTQVQILNFAWKPIIWSDHFKSSSFPALFYPLHENSLTVHKCQIHLVYSLRKVDSHIVHE